MRAVSFFVLFLVLAAVVLSVASAQPPPPRHQSIIIMFNDSACTQHLRTERVFEPPSNKCEVEEGRGMNFSSIFECTTMNNMTSLMQEVFNGTEKCDTTPIISLASSATAHTCAPIAVTYEGVKAQVYGHIDCAPSNTSRAAAFDDLLSLRGAISVAAQSQQEVQTAGLKGFFARLFAKAA